MANKWHKDERVSMAVQQLLDELTSWERATGRHVTLFLPYLTYYWKYCIVYALPEMSPARLLFQNEWFKSFLGVPNGHKGRSAAPCVG